MSAINVGEKKISPLNVTSSHKKDYEILTDVPPNDGTISPSGYSGTLRKELHSKSFLQIAMDDLGTTLLFPFCLRSPFR